MKANSSSQPRKCHGLTDESARVRPTSLVALSVVWFSLCSCLVWKKQRLFRVFFSFLGNFIVARALQQRWSILPAHKVPSAVGLLNSLSALFSAHQGFEYTALSIMAGYLAFDHWYSALRLSLTFSWGVLEDTLSLSVALILLVMRSSSLHEYTTPIQLWILYKSLVFLRRLSASRRQPFKKRLSVPPRVLIPSQPPKTLKSAELWSIHGVHYDLSDFVNRHPGGRDAILLGRGRDCTALFESYHPFTNQHRLTLQKYRCDVKPGPVTKDDSPDDFYNELCVRVAKTLNEKGIHPIRDRSATWQRTAYYVVIGSAAVASGVAHCRVRGREGGCLEGGCSCRASPVERLATHSLFCDFFTGKSARQLAVCRVWLGIGGARPRCRSLCGQSTSVGQPRRIVGHVLAVESMRVATSAHLRAPLAHQFLHARSRFAPL